MKNLDIKKTEKTFNDLIISSNKNDNSKFYTLINNMLWLKIKKKYVF